MFYDFSRKTGKNCQIKTAVLVFPKKACKHTGGNLTVMEKVFVFRENTPNGNGFCFRLVFTSLFKP